MTNPPKIQTPDDYLDALARLDWSTLSDDEWDALEKDVRRYLLSLSPMQRDQIFVHVRAWHLPGDPESIPAEFLRSEHESRLQAINDPRSFHADYLRRLARHAGFSSRHSESPEDLKTKAAVGALLVQQAQENHKQRIKEQGRIVQCQECAHHFHFKETERLKPYGSTRYLRVCNRCAEKIKEAKRIYQRMR